MEYQSNALKTSCFSMADSYFGQLWPCKIIYDKIISEETSAKKVSPWLGKCHHFMDTLRCSFRMLTRQPQGWHESFFNIFSVQFLDPNYWTCKNCHCYPGFWRSRESLKGYVFFAPPAPAPHARDRPLHEPFDPPSYGFQKDKMDPQKPAKKPGSPTTIFIFYRLVYEFHY